MNQKNSSKKKTSGKRPSNGPFRGAVDGKPFTKENQPSPEAKKAGHQKKRLLKDLLEMAFKGPLRGKLKQNAARYLNVPEESITVEDMMHFRQIERAIGKQNTFAYMAIMDRAYGKPKDMEEKAPQVIEVIIKK